MMLIVFCDVRAILVLRDVRNVHIARRCAAIAAPPAPPKMNAAPSSANMRWVNLEETQHKSCCDRSDCVSRSMQKRVPWPDLICEMM